MGTTTVRIHRHELTNTELTKKRDWHVEWLQAVISYYGTSQQDSFYEAIRQHCRVGSQPAQADTGHAYRFGRFRVRGRRRLSHRKRGARSPDPKVLFTACVRVLPEAVRTLLQQNKPRG